MILDAFLARGANELGIFGEKISPESLNAESIPIATNHICRSSARYSPTRQRSSAHFEVGKQLVSVLW